MGKEEKIGVKGATLEETIERLTKGIVDGQGNQVNIGSSHATRLFYAYRYIVDEIRSTTVSNLDAENAQRFENMVYTFADVTTQIRAIADKLQEVRIGAAAFPLLSGGRDVTPREKEYKLSEIKTELDDRTDNRTRKTADCIMPEIE